MGGEQGCIADTIHHILRRGDPLIREEQEGGSRPFTSPEDRYFSSEREEHRVVEEESYIKGVSALSS